jgi:hypothetical protein
MYAYRFRTLASISKKNEHLCGEDQLKAAIAAVWAHEPLQKKGGLLEEAESHRASGLPWRTKW